VQRELQRRFESETIERALARTPRRRAEHERRLVLIQIRLDFLQIQVVNDDLQAASRAGLPDLQAVAKSAAEITKRAGRLKENLALPKSEAAAQSADAEADMGIEQLHSALSVLSNSVVAFAENPVFERLGVIDAKLSLQASRDLDQIIAVSKRIKRSCEKLKRGKAVAA
jgi:hypothetical protein